MTRLALLLSLAGLLPAAPTVTFTKDFKGAVPPVFSLQIWSDGSAVYREGDADDQPVKFTLTPELKTRIFELLAKVENGKRKLESGLKVANLGAKTLRYENGAEKNEVTYNYTLDPDGQQLTDLFEKLAETQYHLFHLENTFRFDKLGVNKVLLQIETAWDRNRLVGAERFIPILERISRNQSFLNMARERAGKLAMVFKEPKPLPELPKAQ